MQKFPFKTPNEIQTLLKQKQQEGIQEKEWKQVVTYMYNEEDSQQLIAQITDFIVYQNNNQNQQFLEKKQFFLKPKKYLTIQYQDFQKILLDYQLKTHEQFLKPFIQIFKQVDQDNDGIINEECFFDLLTKMQISDEKYMARLLQLIDPYDNQQITFSECVVLFSTEMVQISEENKAVCILQTLAKEKDT